MKIGEITRLIESYAPLSLQEDYDNADLIAGDHNAECSGVLCTLDVTNDVIREAIEKKCNLILSHHPPVFRGLKRVNGYHYVERILIDAIKHDIAIYAAHTNLDNTASGVNARICERLNLRNPTILQPKSGTLLKLITFVPLAEAERLRQALFAAGAGAIGNYSGCSFSVAGTGSFQPNAGTQPFVGDIGSLHREPEERIEVVLPFFARSRVLAALFAVHPYEEVAYDLVKLENAHDGFGSGMIGSFEAAVSETVLLDLLHRAFAAQGIRHTGFVNRPMKKIAVCGGAGSFLIGKAISAGADAFITSDIKYHEFFEADARILLIDIGHYESEQYTTELLHDLLVEKFPTFAVLKSGINTNPVRYFRQA